MNLTEIISLIPIPFLFHRRETHKRYFSVTWKLSKNLKPRDLLGERPFQNYYEVRDFDLKIKIALNKHRNILIKGSSLAGKSRAIFEVLKNNKEFFDVLIPICREIDPNSFIVPYRARFWRKGVVILDDLQRFVEQPGFEHLIREISNRGFIIVASSRTGRDFQLVESKFAQQGLDFRSLFHDFEIEISPIDEDVARKIANRIKKEWARISFNGTIGSIFMELLEMKTRFAEAPDNEKTFLRSLKKLYDCGVFQDKGTFPLSWVRKIITDDEIIFNNTMEVLQLKEFFKVDKEKIKIEPVYVEEIITLFPIINQRLLCKEVAQLFQNDPQVLLKIGDRLHDLGLNDIKVASFMKEAITLYHKVLKHYKFSITPNEYALTQNHLGTAYAILAEIEDTVENCQKSISAHNEALKIFTIDQYPLDYAQTQHYLGIVYEILAEVENKDKNSKLAIVASHEALKIYTKEKFPMVYAAVQNNLGIAYGNLAGVEEKEKNTRQAITNFIEALSFFTIDMFPKDYAMTQLNLGNTYGILSEVENETYNCRKGISACKKALKIFTIDQNPRDYAMTQNTLGNAYRKLATVEDTVENCQRAITAFTNSLKIFTFDTFPLQYASVHSNLGLTYLTLSYVEEKSENCRLAINVWNEALKIHTIGRFPREYARIQHNIGVAFFNLANPESIDGNCQLAIDAFNEALKIRTIDKYPIEYAMTQLNLGTTHGALAHLENRVDNCRLAYEAFNEAKKIYTIHGFPAQYHQLQKNINLLKATCGNSQKN